MSFVSDAPSLMIFIPETALFRAAPPPPPCAGASLKRFKQAPFTVFRLYVYFA
jgi:hypothetical protein